MEKIRDEKARVYGFVAGQIRRKSIFAARYPIPLPSVFSTAIAFPSRGQYLEQCFCRSHLSGLELWWVVPAAVTRIQNKCKFNGTEQVNAINVLYKFLPCNIFSSEAVRVSRLEWNISALSAFLSTQAFHRVRSLRNFSDYQLLFTMLVVVYATPRTNIREKVERKRSSAIGKSYSRWSANSIKLCICIRANRFVRQ